MQQQQQQQQQQHTGVQCTLRSWHTPGTHLQYACVGGLSLQCATLPPPLLLLLL
jgi:hypothetical protein